MINKISQFKDGQLLDLFTSLGWRIKEDEQDLTDLKAYEEIHTELHRRGVELPIY